MNYDVKYIKTSRLNVAYRSAGPKEGGAPKLLLVHGNASSGVFYEPLMEKLQDRYEMLVPDMRCFGDSEAVAIDARDGVRVFSEDIHAFVEAVGWERFTFVGWSLGGGVGMQYAVDHGDRLEALVLQAPLSPFGYGGTYDADGKMLEPAGLASGAACANPQMVEAVLNGNREVLGAAIDATYVAQGYVLPSDVREKCINGILKCKVGLDMFQGDVSQADVWPFVAAGTKGVANTMAAPYCNLSALAKIEHRIPILWIYGDMDLIVSDECFGDFAVLGGNGMIPGYPGEEIFPKQPMVSQTRYVLEQYRANGGLYKEVMVPGAGHGVMLDHEEQFIFALDELVQNRRK
ncbi:MAG: alpha/beta hydrolase [Bacillota bacterium]|nr:alpha/beta hydrolase [Bacillota bacterium]